MRQKAPCSTVVVFILICSVALLCAADIVIAQQPAPEHQPIPAVPHYLRLEAPGGAAVYVKFHKDHVSVAPTLEDLKTAESIAYVQAPPDEQVEFPEIDLPFDKANLPQGVDRLRACFVFSNLPEYVGASEPNGGVYGHINFITNITRAGKKESWSYLIGFYGQTSPSVEEIKLVRIAQLKKVDLVLIFPQQPEKGELGVVLRLREILAPFDPPVPLTAAGAPEYGSLDIIAIKKNGGPVPVWVKIFDSTERVIAGKYGVIQEFDFGPAGTAQYIVNVPKPGKYTCKVGAYLGPLGGTVIINKPISADIR